MARALPAITRRRFPSSHSNCSVSPLGASSMICSRTRHKAPFGFNGMIASLSSRFLMAMFLQPLCRVFAPR
jgi:hypothetical protein